MTLAQLEHTWRKTADAFLSHGANLSGRERDHAAEMARVYRQHADDLRKAISDVAVASGLGEPWDGQ